MTVKEFVLATLMGLAIISTWGTPDVLDGLIFWLLGEGELQLLQVAGCATSNPTVMGVGWSTFWIIILGGISAIIIVLGIVSDTIGATIGGVMLFVLDLAWLIYLTGIFR